MNIGSSLLDIGYSIALSRFMVASRGRQVVPMRPRFLNLCHFTELARGCFRCQAGLRHGLAGNRMVLAGHQYRRESDLAQRRRPADRAED